MLRRRLLAWAMKNHTLRRKYVGTAQISILSDLADFFVPMSLWTTVLVTMGRVAKRPIIVEDRIEIRPTMYLSLAIDHRMIAGKHSIEFGKEIQRLLLHPTELDMGGP